jgi:hypothetical protein
MFVRIHFLISLLFLCNQTSNPSCTPCVRVFNRSQTRLREMNIRMHLAPLTVCMGCIAYGACAGNGYCCFTGCLIGCCECLRTSDEQTSEERRPLIRSTTAARAQSQQQNEYCQNQQKFERLKKEYEQWRQEFAHILNHTTENQPNTLRMVDNTAHV